MKDITTNGARVNGNGANGKHYSRPTQDDWARAWPRLKRRGSELVGPCPNCGDLSKKDSDRFSVSADGVWHCRQCDDFPAVMKAAGFWRGQDGWTARNEPRMTQAEVEAQFGSVYPRSLPSFWVDADGRQYEYDSRTRKTRVTERAASYPTSSAIDIKEARMDYLFPTERLLPLGSYVCFAAAGKTGKSLVVTHIAALLACAGKTILWRSSEDDLASVVKPRLRHLDDDAQSRIHFLLQPIGRFDAKRLPVQPDLLILDPIREAGGLGDSNNDMDVAAFLQPLTDYAERSGCVVLGVTHNRKARPDGDDADGADRVLGSQRWTTMARQVLGLARNGDEATLRITRSNVTGAGPVWRLQFGPSGMPHIWHVQGHETCKPGDAPTKDAEPSGSERAQAIILEQLEQAEAYSERSGMQSTILKKCVTDTPGLTDEDYAAARAALRKAGRIKGNGERGIEALTWLIRDRSETGA